MDSRKEILKSFTEIEQYLAPRVLRSFLDTDFAELGCYHFGLGTWVRNCLLPDDGALLRWFAQCRVFSKDEASALLLEWFFLYQQYQR